jgi:acetolactate synthase-1/2/3 large subunit
MRAADVLAKRLYDAGCRYAFGMPGGEVLTILDALQAAGIEFILAKHENAAGFMAEGVWHRTGAPGILLGTIGPGIANAFNVVANAEQDRVPLIAIAGCLDPGDDLTYTHQIFDHVKSFAPVCKAAFTMTAEAAGEMADKAVMTATTGRCGPVFIDIPVRVAATEVETAYPLRHAKPAPVAPAASADLDWAREKLAAAERPIMLVGYDAVRDGAGAAVKRAAEVLGCPILTTYKAKGIVPEDDPLVVGSFAISPSADKISKPLVAQADLILLAGYDAIEMRPTWQNLWDPAERPVIEITAAVNDQYMHQASVSFVADTGASLAALIDGLSPRATWSGGEPAAARAAMKVNNGATADWGPGAIVDEARKALPRNTIATVDSGAHRIVLSQIYECYEPEMLLQSMGLCTMGCAIPLAAGAKIADPDRPVVAFIGDGGLMMFLGELSTLHDHQIPITVVVFDDASLALIELKQRNMQLANAGVDFRAGYDYGKLAEAFGGTCHTVRDRAALREALETSIQSDRFSLVVCELDRKSYDGVL